MKKSEYSRNLFDGFWGVNQTKIKFPAHYGSTPSLLWSKLHLLAPHRVSPRGPSQTWQGCTIYIMTPPLETETRLEQKLEENWIAIWGEIYFDYHTFCKIIFQKKNVYHTWFTNDKEKLILRHSIFDRISMITKNAFSFLSVYLLCLS